MKIEAANLFVIEKTSNVPDTNVVLDAGENGVWVR